MTKFKIYIGYDRRETLAYDVARSSILRRTSKPKTTIIHPLELNQLSIGGKFPLLTRPVEIRDGKMWCPISQAPMATEFAISRFCVPFLQKKGWALFVDCDVVCLADITELFALADEKYAVMCVKHEHKPTETTKMDAQMQTTYSRKNWSSVVLWNCSHPANKGLILENLNTWPGRDLHAFKWLKDEEIGELPNTWNQLVGCQPIIERKGIVHFTLGGPWISGWAPGQAMDDVWLDELKASGLSLPTSA